MLAFLPPLMAHLLAHTLALRLRRSQPPSYTSEVVAAKQAWAVFFVPEAPHPGSVLGRYIPMRDDLALRLLRGENPCAVLRDGVPYVNYAACPVEDVPPGIDPNPGTIALYGIRFDNLGPKYRRYALLAANWLVRHQGEDGAWHVPFPVPGEDLPKGWVSAMYQGAAISLLLRVYQETGERVYLAAATRALAPFYRPYGQGGVVADTPYGPFPQEYTSPSPPSVLNGGLTAIFGLLDYERATGRTIPLVAAFVATLHRLLPHLTLPGWACYQLRPCQVASPFYMGVATTQLYYLGEVLHDSLLLAWAKRWEADFAPPFAGAAARERAAYGILPP